MFNYMRASREKSAFSCLISGPFSNSNNVVLASLLLQLSNFFFTCSTRSNCKFMVEKLFCLKCSTATDEMEVIPPLLLLLTYSPAQQHQHYYSKGLFEGGMHLLSAENWGIKNFMKMATKMNPSRQLKDSLFCCCSSTSLLCCMQIFEKVMVKRD